MESLTIDAFERIDQLVDMAMDAVSSPETAAEEISNFLAFYGGEDSDSLRVTSPYGADMRIGGGE